MIAHYSEIPTWDLPEPLDSYVKTAVIVAIIIGMLTWYAYAAGRAARRADHREWPTD